VTVHRVLPRSALVFAAALLVGCGGSGERTRTETVIDSVVPREEALRRFREGLPPVDTLAGGAASRDALVEAFVVALERLDTAALRPLVLTVAEFAWLYYPTTPMGLPPYDLSPALMWFQMEGRSRQGIAAALAQRGGRPLAIVGHHCDGPSEEGDNRIWAPCVIRRLQAPGDTVEERLFGPILERGRRYKFVSFANRLD
jgi:hypothetical protein